MMYCHVFKICHRVTVTVTVTGYLFWQRILKEYEQPIPNPCMYARVLQQLLFCLCEFSPMLLSQCILSHVSLVYSLLFKFLVVYSL
jgi:hypothetical protein